MRNIALFIFIFWLLALAPLQFWQWLFCVALLLVALQQKIIPLVPVSCQNSYVSLGSFVLAFGCLWLANQAPIQLPIYWQKTPLLISGSYQVLSHHQDRLLLSVYNLRVLSYPIRPASASTQALNTIHQTYPKPQKGMLRVTSYDKNNNQLFDKNRRGCLVAQVVLKKPHNLNNKGGFDYVSWAQRQGLLANGYIKSYVKHWSGCQLPIFNSIAALRDHLSKKINKLNIKPIAKSLWLGLIIGDTSTLQNQDWQILHRTGTTHLLIISGLHIGLVAGLVLLVLKCLAIGLRKSQLNGWGLVLSGLVALGYGLLTGWGIPAQRAIIMLLFVIVGQLQGVRWPLWQRLCLAMAFTIIWQPDSVYSMGFWFSYIAIFNITLFWQFYTSEGTFFAQKIIALLSSQLGLMAILLPTIAWVTGGLSLVGPLLNLLLIPLFAMLVVPMLLLASLLLLLMPAQAALFFYVGQVLTLLWNLLAWLAIQPASFINVSTWPASVWVLWYMVGGISLVLGRLCWLPLMALVIVLSQLRMPVRDQLTLFDVGQGLAIWVQSGEQHLLYDLGDKYPSGFDLMHRVVLPALKQAGVQAIDRAYISHWDRDHSGGFATLADTYSFLPVDYWVLPVIPPPESVARLIGGLSQTSICEPTQWQQLGNLRIRHLAPLQSQVDQVRLGTNAVSSNNSSCVVQLEINKIRFLLAGDIEKASERQLITTYGRELRSDVLIAPHHGSKTSSSAAFIQAVRPRIILISAGYLNRFNHPHPQVLATYEQNDVVWYSTARHGQITIEVTADEHWQVVDSR